MRSYALVALLALVGCGTEHSITPQQDAGPLDETPPTVAADFVRHEVVQATRTIAVTAADDVGVVRVALEVDGAAVAEATEAPFAIAWDSTAIADGLHDVRVAAFDEAGNRGETEVTPLIVVNTGVLPEYTDAPATNGWVEPTFRVPAGWAGNTEQIDKKYHWDMPAGMTHVLAIMRWPDPTAGWNMIFSIGSGFCPDSGTPLAELTENDGEIVLDYTTAPDALPTGQWFFHTGAANAADMVGQSTPYSVLVVYFP
ncbi:MAG TPA: Ig-like domain-containing protein [Polyangia bacterium]|jgi:hypothetical protein